MQHHAGTMQKRVLFTPEERTRLLRCVQTNAREADVSASQQHRTPTRRQPTRFFAVAETAVQAAERGASQPLVDQKGSGSASGIWMWNASAKSGWQGKAAPCQNPPTCSPSLATWRRSRIIRTATCSRVGAGKSQKRMEACPTVKQQLRQGRSEDDRSVAEARTCCASSKAAAR